MTSAPQGFGKWVKNHEQTTQAETRALACGRIQVQTKQGAVALLQN